MDLEGGGSERAHRRLRGTSEPLSPRASVSAHAGAAGTGGVRAGGAGVCASACAELFADGKGT